MYKFLDNLRTNSPVDYEIFSILHTYRVRDRHPVTLGNKYVFFFKGERGLKSEVTSLMVEKNALEGKINSLLSSRSVVRGVKGGGRIGV